MTITTRPTRAVLAAAIALLAVAGCGGGDDNATGSASSTEQASDADGTDSHSTNSEPAEDEESSAAGGDPCRLLTSAEAEAILGSPVGEGQPTEQEIAPGQTIYDCAYHVPGGLARSVHVGVLGDAFPKDQWEQGIREDGVIEVDGVGELAFFNENDYKIDVFDDGRWIQAQIIDSPRFAELEEMLIEVVRNALERI